MVRYPVLDSECDGRIASRSALNLNDIAPIICSIPFDTAYLKRKPRKIKNLRGFEFIGVMGFVINVCRLDISP